MAIRFNCPNCPTPLKVKNELAGTDIVCHKCGFMCRVPFDDTDPEERAERKAKRKARAQIEFELGMLSTGLLIHYGTMAVHVLGLVLFFAGFGNLALALAVPELRDTMAREIAGYFLTGAVIVTMVAVLGDTVVAICALRVPLRIPALLLRLWLLVPPLVIALGIWFFFSGSWYEGVAAAVLVVNLLGWAAWIGFLLAFPVSIKLYDLAQEIGLTLVWFGLGLVSLGAIVVAVSAGIGFMIVYRDNPYLQVGILTGLLFFLVALWGTVWTVTNEDSPLVVLLYPIGVGGALQYITTLETLRSTVDRRL